MKKVIMAKQVMAALLTGILILNSSTIGFAKSSNPQDNYQTYKKQLVERQKQEKLLTQKVWKSSLQESPVPKNNYVPGEILVKFRGNFNPQKLFGTLGIVSLAKNSFNFYRVKVVKDIDVPTVLNKLRENKNVESAQLNHIYQAYNYNDLRLNQQWSLTNIDAQRGWSLTTGSSKIKVAIVDTGVDLSHPEFKGRIEAGYNAINPLKSSRDDVGHGTHVAGIVAAAINNQIGVSGIAPNVKILPVKVLDKSGYGNNYNIADGIKWAVDNGAKVINLSLGGPEFSPILDAAVQYAFSHNVLVVAAAGNEASDEMSYPASLANVMSVSATNNLDQLAFFSNFGEYNDISAPGMDIYSTYWDEEKGSTYGKFSGTSMAAPLVAGLAADILSINPTLKPQEVQQIIEQSAKDLGEKGWDQKFGYGRINAFQAIQLAKKYRPLPLGTWEKATLLTNGQLASGSIQTAYDVDYYQFNIVKEGALEIHGVGTKNQDLSIEVFDKAKQKLTTINYGKTGAEKALLPNLKSGKYYLRISDKANHWGTDKYQISVTQIAEGEQILDVNEPNNEYQKASQLVIGDDNIGKASGVLGSSEDTDWFKINIKEGEKYKLHLTSQDGLDPIISVYSNEQNYNEAIPVQEMDQVSDNNGNEADLEDTTDEDNYSEEQLSLVQKIDNYSLGQGEEGTLENLPAGIYYIKLADTNKNVVNQSYTLSVERTLVSGSFDPFENNDTPEKANHLVINGGLSGAKLTKDDIDWYTVEVKEPGILNLDVRKDSKGSLDMAVYDEEVLTKGQDTEPLKIIWGEKQQVQGSLKVVPGQYFIRVMGNQFSWGEEYDLKVHWEARSFDPYEINDTPEKASPIFINNLYKGNLGPEDEVDYYRVNLKENQTVAVKVTPDKTSDLTVTILKVATLNIPDHEEDYYELIQLIDTGSRGELDAGLVKVMEEGDYLIQVSSKYKSEKQNYTLAVENYKLQKDPWEDNNNRKKAKVIALNKTIQPNLLGPNDVDWYQLNIPKKKKLTVKLTTSKDIDGVIELFDSRGRLIAVRDDVMAGDQEILNFTADKGKYFLRITDNFGNGSLLSYKLENHY